MYSFCKAALTSNTGWQNRDEKHKSASAVLHLNRDGDWKKCVCKFCIINLKKFREVRSGKEANSRTSAAAAAPTIHIRRLGTSLGTQISSERVCYHAEKQGSGSREADMNLPELNTSKPHLSPAELQQGHVCLYRVWVPV